MHSSTALPHNIIKIENSPEPELVCIPSAPLADKPLLPVASSMDPENFLKRCSGYSKKTSMRCSASIGKRAQKELHPTFLPTCGAHRDQQSLAGWCQFKGPDGERCGRLFRWKPPYFELCDEHQGHPGTPCYFLKQLPLELRNEIYRYLMPTEPIGSSTAAVHDQPPEDMYPTDSRSCILPCGYYTTPMRSTRLLRSKFPMRLLDLLLVSRQVHDEVKDLLFRIATFKIDVRKDGTFMCGRRLLEPKRADGSSHFLADEADLAKKKFLRSFDWASVKNYTVDILLENWASANPNQINSNVVSMAVTTRWDEEVEIYDIRDYISVVVSGILAKAKKLYKLQVRLCLADFVWKEEQILSNAKLLFSPFERLRNVRQPSLGGVFSGKPSSNNMYPVEPITGRYPIAIGHGCVQSSLPGYYELCSVPSLPTDNPILFPGMPAFDDYASDWRRQISSEGSANVTPEPLIRKMFTEFRNFYTELASHVPEVAFKTGKHTFLHRARVAREQEDVIAFRAIREELLGFWDKYLKNEQQKKRTMQARIVKFLESDTYPSHIWEEHDPNEQDEPLSGSSSQSPVALDAETMAREGIPMTGNSVRRPFVQPPFNQMGSHSGVPPNPYSTVPTISETAQKQYLTQKYAYVYLQQQALQRQRAQQQAQQLQQAQQQARMRALIQERQASLKRKASAGQETDTLDTILPVCQCNNHNNNNNNNNNNSDLYSSPQDNDDDENNNNTPPSSEQQQQQKQCDTHQVAQYNLPPANDPGPSTVRSKRRRVDSGCEERGDEQEIWHHDEKEEDDDDEQDEQDVVRRDQDDMSGLHFYVGKGKGKEMGYWG